MNEIKHIIHITAAISILLFCLLIYIVPHEGSFHNALYSIDLAILSLVAISKWFWYRIPFSLAFKNVPHIAGKWKGHLISDYSEETKSKPIATTFSIKQTLFSCSIRSETSQSTSYSLDVHFTRRSADSIDIVYSYKNEPGIDIQTISRPHYGTTVLHCIAESPDTISGFYFTDRKTSGTLKLSKSA